MSVFFLLVYVSVGFVTAINPYTVIFMSYVLVCFLYIPLLILCLYLSYRLLKPCCARVTICKNKKKQNLANDEPSLEYQPPLISDVSVTNVSLDDLVADDLYADRILNPNEYKEQ